ncbi:MAG TPA: hypothetical protein PKK00_04690 [Bacteroidales bacterium]|nr:hypothetical protein [Bacteroidales bacterium]HPS16762.1 hypothetical protein [Bacteroidales bacterium]
MENTSGIYSFKEIGNEYNREMLELLHQSPIEAKNFSICFDREPDIFKMANLKYHPAEYTGFFKGSKLIGFALIGYYNAYVNGKPQKVFHFSNFFIQKDERKKFVFFKAFKVIYKNVFDNSDLGYAVVLQGNKNAESLIGRENTGNTNYPYSSIINTLDARSIMIMFRKKTDTAFHVRKATTADIDSIVELLQKEFSERIFAPYVDKQVFQDNLLSRPDFGIENYYVAEKDDIIHGVCAAWDCGSFKQSRIIKYNSRFKVIKNIYSIMAALFGFTSLPKTSEAFKEVHITDYAVNERNPKIMKALLCKVYNDYRDLKYNTIIFGSYKNDELLKSVKGFINQSVLSNIIAISKNKNSFDEKNIVAEKPYIDIALL